MNIVINNQTKIEIFTSIFQHIKLFSDNVNIMFEKDRLYLQTMDGSRVSIFELYMPSTWFDTYENKNNASVTIGLNSTMLFKILNTHEKGQLMNIVYDNDDDKLFIKFHCDDKNIFDKNFEIPLIDIDSELLGIPDFESQADISIPSNNFATIINQLKMFGDTLDIDCSEEKILLISNSQESGKMSVEINIDDLDSFAINDGETLKLSFALSYLHNICMYNKLSKIIEIKLTREYPMKITYHLIDDGIMVFYLAPKMSDDDE
jgi:proliferating cell nuclear antigen PCNA